eukprot:scaffold407_cov251-Pinguiococcus_pyrenoidosus.AAC.46
MRLIQASIARPHSYTGFTTPRPGRTSPGKGIVSMDGLRITRSCRRYFSWPKVRHCTHPVPAAMSRTWKRSIVVVATSFTASGLASVATSRGDAEPLSQDQRGMEEADLGDDGAVSAAPSVASLSCTRRAHRRRSAGTSCCHHGVSRASSVTSAATAPTGRACGSNLGPRGPLGGIRLERNAGLMAFVGAFSAFPLSGDTRRSWSGATAGPPGGRRFRAHAAARLSALPRNFAAECADFRSIRWCPSSSLLSAGYPPPGVPPPAVSSLSC